MAVTARSRAVPRAGLGAARRLRARHVPAAALGIAAAVIVATGIFAPVLAPADPNTLNLAQAFKPPSAGVWFGTDETGRDILSRTIWGTRVSLAAAGMVLLISMVLGILIGSVAGYRGGVIDDILMRLADLFLAFPGLVLAIAITAALGPSLRNAVIAVAIVWWPTYARLIRSRVLTVKAMLYIEAAHAVGVSDAKILFRHVLPQCWGIIVSRMTVDVGYAILLTASLSFLGLGSQPPTAEWGSMIATSRPYFFSYWWTVTFPGLAMFVTVLVFSFFGDVLYETFGIKGGRQM
ncbi:MAG TPA: ABC transporter permease [bacterium]|nr:ABC transporter permease [bacterium]